jgi:hypothetical protein
MGWADRFISRPYPRNPISEEIPIGTGGNCFSDPGDGSGGVDGDEEVTESDYYQNVIVPLIQAEEQKVRDSEDALFQKFNDIHQRELAEFRFECVRFGDFLNIFMTRSKDERYEHKPHKFNDAVNLNLTRNISIEPGRAPDREGKTGYNVISTKRLIFTHSRDGYYRPDFTKPPVDDTHGILSSQYTIPDYHYQLSYHEGEQGQDRYSFHYPMSSNIDHYTDNAPRPSIDDEIKFVGHGLVLRVPAGKGEEVKQKILAACRAGYTPPDSIINP